jgi:tetratricopeptide (TPR) repeat protein
LLSSILSLAGCANNTKTNARLTENADLESVLSYYQQLPSDHPDRIETLLAIPEEAKSIVQRKFGRYNKSIKGTLLAQWLMNPEGHRMVYDINANLPPADVFNQRRGNCLSFTLLLLQLSKELNIDLHVNQVDLPDMWGQSDNQDLVFYRHVNAIQRTKNLTHIYDLAMQNYRQGFPQRLLNETQAVALLFSNNGIQLMQQGKFKKAFHYLKLAASLFPDNSDMWVNLGAAYKSTHQPRMAELSYLLAFDLKSSNSLAASNLDRLYRSIGEPSKAKSYAKLAQRARLKNPYVRFESAQTAFTQKRYKEASKEIKSAIKLHAEDPQFFELSSRVKKVQKKYIAALKDLDKAHQLASKDSERDRYAYKAKMVVERVKAQILANTERNDQRGLRRLQYQIDNYNKD